METSFKQMIKNGRKWSRVGLEESVSKKKTCVIMMNRENTYRNCFDICEMELEVVGGE